jgi:hypothetical protein
VVRGSKRQVRELGAGSDLSRPSSSSFIFCRLEIFILFLLKRNKTIWDITMMMMMI